MMDATSLVDLIDTIRMYNDFESTIIALFSQGICEDDSTCFSKFFDAQENLLDLFLNELCGGEDEYLRLYDSDSDAIDAICSRFYDDDVRSGAISSLDLLREFLSILREETGTDESV